MSYRNRSEKHGYRTDRIERAAAEALECDLLPSLEDPLLNDLHVLSIDVRTLACIRVTLAPGPAASSADPQTVETALSRVENKLRIELAGILRIKRMPLLRISYVPLPMGSQPTGGDA